MSTGPDQWEEAFAAFDIDLIKAKASPAQPPQGQQPAAATASPSKPGGDATEAHPEDPVEAPHGHEAAPRNHEDDLHAAAAAPRASAAARSTMEEVEREKQEALRQIEEKTKAIEAAFPPASMAPPDDDTAAGPDDAPAEADDDEAPPPISQADIEQMAARVGQLSADAAQQAAQLQQLIDNRRARLPKGIRTARRLMAESATALDGVQALLLALAATDDDAVFAVVDRGATQSAVSTDGELMAMTFSELPDLLARLHDALDTGDDEAPLLARQVFDAADGIHLHALRVAEGAAADVELYASPYAELDLFSTIAATADAATMDTIDRAMALTDAHLVSVADAPAMVEALRTGNQQAAADIVRRLIDARPTPVVRQAS